MAGDILAAIDGALDDYATSGDAMRWTPGSAELYVGDGNGGWTHIGHTCGPVELTMPPAADIPQPFRIPGPITVTIAVDISDFTGKLARAYRLIHDLDRSVRPKQHRRCHTCHPGMAPRPLAVDGREYHRRQQARLRRKHR